MSTWHIEDRWNEKNPHFGKTIRLTTIEELKRRDPDSIVVCIDGTESKVKDADNDTRAGYTAFGDIID